MRSYPALSYARVSDGKERTQSETIGSGFRIPVPHLPQLRSGRVVIQRPPQRGSLPCVRLRAGSQCLGNAPADNRPAGRPRKPRLRVRPPRDAPSTGRGIPLSGLQFGGSTRKIRIPRGSCRHEQRSSPIRWQKSQRTASTEEAQPKARDASAGRRQAIERSARKPQEPAEMSQTYELNKV